MSHLFYWFTQFYLSHRQRQMHRTYTRLEHANPTNRKQRAGPRTRGLPQHDRALGSKRLDQAGSGYSRRPSPVRPGRHQRTTAPTSTRRALDTNPSPTLRGTSMVSSPLRKVQSDASAAPAPCGSTRFAFDADTAPGLVLVLGILLV